MVANIADRQPNSSDVVENIYIILEKHLSPGLLERFLKNAHYAKGSRSVHGFIVALREHHDMVQRKKDVRFDAKRQARVLEAKGD